jgi:hypothetical protein
MERVSSQEQERAAQAVEDEAADLALVRAPPPVLKPMDTRQRDGILQASP